jgi:hypothetical protein
MKVDVSFERFEELKKIAGEALNMPSDAGRSVTLASLQLLLEQMIARVAANQTVDASAFVRLVELLDRINPAAPLQTVNIAIVGRDGETCSIDELKAARAGDPEPPSDPPLSPNGGGDGPASAEPAASGDSANVVPFKPAPAPAAHKGGSINDAVLPDGSRPPIKRYASGFYPGEFDTANPFAAGPKPDFESHHSLPPVNYKGVVW